MVYYLLVTIYVIVCGLLIITILLQQGLHGFGLAHLFPLDSAPATAAPASAPEAGQAPSRVRWDRIEICADTRRPWAACSTTRSFTTAVPTGAARKASNEQAAPSTVQP